MTTEVQTTEVTETSTEATEAKRRGRKRKLTEKQLARAKQLYTEKGWAPAKIASQTWCPVSASALYYHLRGASPVGDTTEVSMRRRGRTGPSEAQIEFLVAQHQAGERVSNIREMPQMRRGAELGADGELVKRGGPKKFAAQTLSKELRDRGFELKRGRPPVAKEETEEVSEETASE